MSISVLVNEHQPVVCSSMSTIVWQLIVTPVLEVQSLCGPDRGLGDWEISQQPLQPPGNKTGSAM